jgi:membrane-bound metal-dependent hydrolase YbcI (DUF457 family)
MPLPLGHAAIGLAACETFQPADARRSRLGTFLMAVTLANLPDADILLGLLVQGNGNLFHRGPTHSIVFALLAGYIASHVWRLGPRFPRLGFPLCFSLVLSHVLADMVLTSAPVSLLWPLHVYWSPGISDWGSVTYAVVFQSIQDAGILVACTIYLSILRLMRTGLKRQHAPLPRRRFK